MEKASSYGVGYGREINYPLESRTRAESIVNSEAIIPGNVRRQPSLAYAKKSSSGSIKFVPPSQNTNLNNRVDINEAKPENSNQAIWTTVGLAVLGLSASVVLTIAVMLHSRG